MRLLFLTRRAYGLNRYEAVFSFLELKNPPPVPTCVFREEVRFLNLPYGSDGLSARQRSLLAVFTEQQLFKTVSWYLDTELGFYRKLYGRAKLRRLELFLMELLSGYRRYLRFYGALFTLLELTRRRLRLKADLKQEVELRLLGGMHARLELWELLFLPAALVCITRDLKNAFYLEPPSERALANNAVGHLLTTKPLFPALDRSASFLKEAGLVG
ncbi:MAG: hypothetical protein GXO03_00805 [Aquificae bacterium]|nr:hypothetical protein [Aquificota bacterium]